MSNAISTSPDPFDVLGLARGADETEVRARYLDLVKQYPPDRDPEKFRQIRAAYEATKDPLVIAAQLTQPPDEEVPEWADTIEAQKATPPRLAPGFLLSLGNRDAKSSTSTKPTENTA